MAASAKTMAAFILAAIIVLLGVTARAESPPESAIDLFTYMGSGCPANSAVGEISKDGQVLTMEFSEFSAETDAGNAGKRKNCQISLKMRYPAGWTYSLETVSLRGYTRLDDKAKAVHRVSYYFTGEGGQGRFTKETEGAYDDNYEHSGPFSPVISSLCGQNRNLNVNMEIAPKGCFGGSSTWCWVLPSLSVLRGEMESYPSMTDPCAGIDEGFQSQDMTMQGSVPYSSPSPATAQSFGGQLHEGVRVGLIHVPPAPLPSPSLLHAAGARQRFAVRPPLHTLHTGPTHTGQASYCTQVGAGYGMPGPHTFPVGGGYVIVVHMYPTQHTVERGGAMWDDWQWSPQCRQTSQALHGGMSTPSPMSVRRSVVEPSPSMVDVQGEDMDEGWPRAQCCFVACRFARPFLCCRRRSVPVGFEKALWEAMEWQLNRPSIKCDNTLASENLSGNEGGPSTETGPPQPSSRKSGSNSRATENSDSAAKTQRTNTGKARMDDTISGGTVLALLRRAMEDATRSYNGGLHSGQGNIGGRHSDRSEDW
ncbi:hypothetical protein CBR_g68708 [Chara braunii]|uniref:CUB domain-containing protein n=1 Tax=Chara braunii TaxID=69332 RepID=A0A388K9G7_CHABU|nr:hypothetical protein CBR_g68708 [Chara braunii]|eukprot:GBG66724.1 hypothetical protein CBR_g68708 [Chara braunii]